MREHDRLHLATGDGRTGTRVGDRTLISAAHFRKLRRFDEKQADSDDDLVFRWCSKTLAARQFVGVIQIDELTIEILPKIEETDDAPSDDDSTSGRRFSQRNLLYMLSLAGRVPLRSRDVANVSVHKATLLDIFVELFATRLLDELKRGLDQSYVDRAENLSFLRGKLQFSKHLRENLWRKERFFVEYDEYLPDTTMNRIFKYACRRLYRSVSRPQTEHKLQQCLALLTPVDDRKMTLQDFERVRFSRQNERFREAFAFCRLLFQGLSPSPAVGDDESYAVLFDMWTVYEDFITAFIGKYVLNSTEFGDYRYRPQSKGLQRHLLHERGEGSRRKLNLQPDILIELIGESHRCEDGKPLRLIADTKWKRLSRTSHGNVGDISGGDLYQMYAYTHRFDARCSVLLYPRGAFELPDEDFVLPGTKGTAAGEKSVHIRFVNLNRDLSDRREQKALASELRQMIFELLRM